MKAVEKVFTHRDGDLRWQLCRCCKCGVERQCTPQFDFYADDGDPLVCESCLLKAHGFSKIEVVLVDGLPPGGNAPNQ